MINNVILCACLYKNCVQSDTVTNTYLYTFEVQKYPYQIIPVGP